MNTQLWKFSQIVRVLLLSSALVIITGCTKPMHINIKAYEKCNKGYPVILRVYQLKNDTNFQRATIQSLWPDDQKALAGEFIAKEEFTLHPGESKIIEFKLAKDTRFVAACADFHEPDSNGWRRVESIKSLKGKKVWIVCGEDNLQIIKR